MNTYLPTGKDYPIASAHDTAERQMRERGSDGSTGIGETMGQESRYNSRSTRSGGGVQSGDTSMMDQSGGSVSSGATHSMGTSGQSMGSVTNSKLAQGPEGMGQREVNSQSGGMESRLNKATGIMSNPALNTESSAGKTASSAGKEAEEEEEGFLGKVKKTLGI